MDSQSTYDDLPWELIVSALQGELSPDEDLRFRQWLALSADNRQDYDRLLQLWTDGMADFVFYRAANEGNAWEALREKMGDRAPARKEAPAQGREEARVIGASFEKPASRINRAPRINRWAAVAAVLLLAAGAGWWYFSGKNAGIRYETALNEQKKISLPDGSTISLNPQTRIRVADDYNKTGRTVTLAAGEAYFEVSHREQLPFKVDMETASVRDIGTSFTVTKTKDSIKVMVTSGKVAFIEKETGETRQISAGSSLCLYIAEHRFGEIRATDTTNGGAGALRFDNAPLSDIIAALQKMYDKKILLNDTATAQKKLTVHLDGESFDNDLKIICASLDLEYAQTSGVYILKSRDTATKKRDTAHHN